MIGCLHGIGDGGERSTPCSNCRRCDIACVKATKGFRFKAGAKQNRIPGFATNQPWLPSSTSETSFLDETANFAGNPMQDEPSSLIEQSERTQSVESRGDLPPHGHTDDDYSPSSSLPAIGLLPASEPNFDRESLHQLTCKDAQRTFPEVLIFDSDASQSVSGQSPAATRGPEPLHNLNTGKTANQ
jgi:hypothetical protein